MPDVVPPPDAVLPVAAAVTSALSQPQATIAAALITAAAVAIGLVVQVLVARHAVQAQNTNADAAVTQRYDADRRDAQWKRIEWALDLMLADDRQGRSDTISGAALRRFLQDATLHPDDRLVVGQALQSQRDHLRATLEAVEAMTDEAYDARDHDAAAGDDGHHDGGAGHWEPGSDGRAGGRGG